MAYPEDAALSGVITQLSKAVDKLSDKLDELDGKLDDVALTYVTKAEYADSKRTRMTVILGVAAMIVSIAIATWTIIATRQTVVVEGSVTGGLIWLCWRRSPPPFDVESRRKETRT